MLLARPAAREGPARRQRVSHHSSRSLEIVWVAFFSQDVSDKISWRTGRAACVALLLVVVPLLPACQLFLPVGTVLGYEILTEI